MTAVEKDADTSPDERKEAGNDTDDLDALLSSYDGEEKQPHKPEQKQKQDDIPEWARKLQADLEDIRSQTRLEKQRSALEESVSEIKKQFPALKDFPDDWLEDRLVGRADRDPRILTAFSRRNIDKAGWKKVLKGLGKEMAAYFEKEDKEDDVAAAAAARGVSTRRSDNDTVDKVNKMSPAEFAAFERQLASR